MPYFSFIINFNMFQYITDITSINIFWEASISQRFHVTRSFIHQKGPSEPTKNILCSKSSDLGKKQLLMRRVIIIMSDIQTVLGSLYNYFYKVTCSTCTLLSGMILLYLAKPFFILKVFLHKIIKLHISSCITTIHFTVYDCTYRHILL